MSTETPIHALADANAALASAITGPPNTREHYLKSAAYFRDKARRLDADTTTLPYVPEQPIEGGG